MTPDGIEQAKKRALKLRKVFDSNEYKKPAYIYCSPCRRTIETVQPIAQQLQLPIILVPGLSKCAMDIESGKLYLDTDTNELFVIRNELFCTFLTYEQVNKMLNGDQTFNDDENINNINKIIDIFSRNMDMEDYKTSVTDSSTVIKFEYDFSHMPETYDECISRLFDESNDDIVMCITHREGFRICQLKENVRIRYCDMYKYQKVADVEKKKSDDNSNNDDTPLFCYLSGENDHII